MANSLTVVVPTPSLIPTVSISVKKSVKKISARAKPKTCLLSAYTKHRKTCLRDYRDAACEITLSLLPGKEYELDVPPAILGPPIVVVYTVTGNFLSKDRERLPASGTCHFVRTRTEQEDYEGW